jgi:hypothetical protein
MNVLSEKNFLLYAAKYYDNPQCIDTEEFLEDLKRIKYIRRLLNKYIETGEIKEQLLLNHLIVLYNVFGVVPCTKILFFKLKDLLPYLKPFLVLLNTLPEKVTNVEEAPIYTDEIAMDSKLVDRLRKI